MTPDPMTDDRSIDAVSHGTDATAVAASPPNEAPPDRALLDRVEREIARVEATLAQLSDPATDPAAVTSWLPTA